MYTAILVVSVLLQLTGTTGVNTSMGDFLEAGALENRELNLSRGFHGVGENDLSGHDPSGDNSSLESENKPDNTNSSGSFISVGDNSSETRGLFNGLPGRDEEPRKELIARNGNILRGLPGGETGINREFFTGGKDFLNALVGGNTHLFNSVLGGDKGFTSDLFGGIKDLLYVLFGREKSLANSNPFNIPLGGQKNPLIGLNNRFSGLPGGDTLSYSSVLGGGSGGFLSKAKQIFDKFYGGSSGILNGLLGGGKDITDILYGGNNKLLEALFGSKFGAVEGGLRPKGIVSLLVELVKGVISLIDEFQQTTSKLTQSLTESLKGVDVANKDAIIKALSSLPINHVCVVCDALPEGAAATGCREFCSEGRCRWQF